MPGPTPLFIGIHNVLHTNNHMSTSLFGHNERNFDF